jgi:hypothetical protein
MSSRVIKASIIGLAALTMNASENKPSHSQEVYPLTSIENILEGYHKTSRKVKVDIENITMQLELSNQNSIIIHYKDKRNDYKRVVFCTPEPEFVGYRKELNEETGTEEKVEIYRGDKLFDLILKERMANKKTHVSIRGEIIGRYLDVNEIIINKKPHKLKGYRISPSVLNCKTEKI